MSKIHNPVLTGFHPDPSICRVGEDFYIANSTFHWFPGVRISHSRDLVHWRPVGYALTRTSQLDMEGENASCGIWAPCLTHADGRFWLIYTDVKSHGDPFKDTPNYLVTAENIEGPWSEPIFLNASGFDPSLFHDDDGRKWLVNMLLDDRPGRNTFGGIVLQEYDHAQQKLIGERVNICLGTDLGYTEGPHLYKHDGRYYLMLAEGGTGYGHAVTVARADAIEGPYAFDPAGPVCTSREAPELALQKAGHASICDTPDGKWYLAHLCGRPFPPTDNRECMLGRETAIQQVHWTEDGWLRMVEGGPAPAVDVAAPDLPAHPFPPAAPRDDFDAETLGTDWQTLREPFEESWGSLTARPGHLRLRGRKSPVSNFQQSLVARRVQDFEFQATTQVEFRPKNFQQAAGLVMIYDERVWLQLCVTHNEDIGRCLQIRSLDGWDYVQPLAPGLALPGEAPVQLRMTLRDDKLTCSYSIDGGETFRSLDFVDRGTRFSDEHCAGRGAFTGAFVGMCCHDLDTYSALADFEFFEYRPLD